MALAPRTLLPEEPFEDIEAFLEHLWFHLLASALTVALAPQVETLLTNLDVCRVERRALARALGQLKAKEIFSDDELNLILDQVKAALSSDKSDAGLELYKDVFDGKGPSETRKYILGPQLTAMSVWPGKLAGSSRPEVNALGLQALKATGEATQLLNDGGQAATVLDQFDMNTRATFVESCNAGVKLVFGKLSEIEHTPPPGATGPIPAGFVDRFFLRDTSSRAPTIKELEKTVAGTKNKLAHQQAQLDELKANQAKDLKEKQDAVVAEKTKELAAQQKIIDDAAAAMKKLQDEIAKEKAEPPV